MAKNVSITEDGTNKVAENVAKIRTSLVGGGTCDWIPKDDVPLETLEVSEDGTYRPGEDYYGFDKVIASGIGTVTMGELIEKTVTKNGTYNITDESGSHYGYSKIIVNVDTSDDSGGDSGGGGGNTPVVGKDEDGNDTMAETDDDGNIVMTALPTEIKVIIPPTKLEYNRYEEIDYSGISVYAYISKEVHWLGTTTTAISEGSTNNVVVIGKKNVSASIGDGVLYAPDRTGENDVRLVWDGTKWVKSSNYTAEKAMWRTNKYPSGKIPFEELIFPMKRMNRKDNDTYTAETWKKSPFSDTQDTISEYTIHVYNNLIAVYGWWDRTGPWQGWIIGGGYPGVTQYVEFFYRCDTIIYSRNTNVHILLRKYNSNGGNREGWFTLLVASDSIEGIVSKDVLMNHTLNPPAPQTTQDIIYSTSPSHPEYYVNEKDYAGINLSGPLAFVQNTSDKYDGSTNYIIDSPSSSSISYNTATYFNKTVYYYTRIVQCIPSNAGHVPEQYSFKGNEIQSNGSITVCFSNSGYYINTEADTIIYDTDQSLPKQAWTMVYGKEEKRNITYAVSLPVQWKRPGDGKILETTFTAWMIDDGEGGNNTSGNSQPGSQNIDVPQ